MAVTTLSRYLSLKEQQRRPWAELTSKPLTDGHMSCWCLAQGAVTARRCCRISESHHPYLNLCPPFILWSSLLSLLLPVCSFLCSCPWFEALDLVSFLVSVRVWEKQAWGPWEKRRGLNRSITLKHFLHLDVSSTGTHHKAPLRWHECHSITPTHSILITLTKVRRTHKRVACTCIQRVISSW